jgi:hypothetical protein
MQMDVQNVYVQWINVNQLNAVNNVQKCAIQMDVMNVNVHLIVNQLNYNVEVNVQNEKIHVDVGYAIVIIHVNQVSIVHQCVVLKEDLMDVKQCVHVQRQQSYRVLLQMHANVDVLNIFVQHFVQQLRQQ